MPAFFDTHVHFDQADGEHGIAATVERARAAGVARLVAVGGSPALNALAARAGRAFPDGVWVALGLDRDQAPGTADPAAVDAAVSAGAAAASELEAAGIRLCAVGEVGLDYHHHGPAMRPGQCALLRAQLALARRRGLPVVVHSREADEDTLAELEAHRRAWSGDPGRLGVLHCFTGGPDFARALLDLDFHISFSGIVTFRNANPLRDVARGIPDERLLLESDAPYLAPVPYRGRRNEPAFLPATAAVVARVRSCPVERIEEMTAANALRLFGPP